MEPTPQDLEIERGAFRVDVCGHQLSVPTDQAPAEGVERQLIELARPSDASAQARATAAAQEGVAAIDSLMRTHDSQAAAAAATRQRRTRLRKSTAPIIEAPAVSEATPMFVSDDWEAAAAPGIVRAGLKAVCSKVDGELSVACGDEVVDGVMCFEIGDGSRSVLGVAACCGLDVDTPFTSGLMESVVAAMNSHARRNADVRHAWAILLGPGRVRLCLMEPDAIHVSMVQSTTGHGGRLLLCNAVAHAAFTESPRLGGDSSMRWRPDIERWEIECPGSDDLPARVVFAEREPKFIADTFFGRFTRCFAVSLSPDDSNFEYALKDSWQLVPTGKADAELQDEVSILRGMHAALDQAQCDGGVLQRLLCGGTVTIDSARDSTELVLGTELNTYPRWTVAHGSSRSVAAHRLHRRMVSGPMGVPLHELRDEKEVVAAVAGAMVAYATIFRCTGILHRDISLGNVLAVRQPDGSVHGMLIDFDHSALLDEERNVKKPGHVGTLPCMSTANLEGLDVSRTTLDDWEAALALLLCLAARPSRRDELCARLASVGSNGVAEFRREMFASRKSLEVTITDFIDPDCVHALRLIRALYVALFTHPSCAGTARRMLRGNRLVDPIVRRVQFAPEVHGRCLAVITGFLAQSQSGSLESLMALPKSTFVSFSSAGSGSTATLQPPPMAPVVCPLPVHPLLPVPLLPDLCGLGALRMKRKAHENVEASPRVKRRKMTHDDVGFAPANFAPPPAPDASAEDSSTVVGDTHSSVSSIAPLREVPGASPVGVFVAQGLVTPRGGLNALREAPPVVSSPKRRRLF
ncbi:hypothetical protein IWW39_001384 [Coemansia spiralis]|uniref:Fungal-type protein kinase domain-containing protein n=1 Tax=Coemansia spiralis TaxID=417178 RepID=A0A9W8GMI5_9FUNG|nr:hypothetical protein IWW39_001384 [Coemansia spiralis]